MKKILPLFAALISMAAFSAHAETRAVIDTNMVKSNFP